MHRSKMRSTHQPKPDVNEPKLYDSQSPPPMPEGYEQLVQLALDLRSSWNHRADALWEAIDSELWRETSNAWLVVRSASPVRLRELLATPSFRDCAAQLHSEAQRHRSTPGWFQQRFPASTLGKVAFFSLEFAVSESLPLYSGGLGNVAGDYLKAASDLGVPLVGVGLLYQQGYFRQLIDAAGMQHESYPFNDTSQLPIAPLRDATGDWVRVRLPRAGEPVWLRGWQAQVGRVRLVLLDSNDPSNAPTDRGITGQLYGGGAETRLLQEMALGIGGWRLLRALGHRPEVCHLNEGHAALAAIERARDFMGQTGQPFDVALAATRPGNVFTTHTPVEAGFDRFAPDLVATYLGTYVREELGVRLEDFLALGRAHPDDPTEALTMAWLALRGCGAVNGVSRRHGDVSRSIFQVLFPRWPAADVPVSHVTNGVHAPSWDSAEADKIWTEAYGPERWRGRMTMVKGLVGEGLDVELWASQGRARARLVDFVRARLSRQLASSGVDSGLDVGGELFDPDALTIGLARRFTSYKRPTLLLHDPERLARIVRNQTLPVQIVVAGKAHPRDDEGKGFVQSWVRFARRPDMRARVVFLADYDLRLAEQLVQGVDLWINTPRPPWEACGTSGMKVLVNGGLNLSSLDGWWAEAYTPEVGWALPGDGRDDAQDAARLYDLLERDVIPTFYKREPNGVASAWVARMRASMSSLAPVYSADRAVRDYTERYYVRAAERLAARIADRGSGAASIVKWEQMLKQHWSTLRFGDVRADTSGGRHRFSVHVYLDDVDPSAVTVELYADARSGTDPSRVAMTRGAPLVGARGFVYVGDVADDRPSTDFTPRLLPFHADAQVPLELPLILWQR
jgi:starch phosphorylase